VIVSLFYLAMSLPLARLARRLELSLRRRQLSQAAHPEEVVS
jgi:ABC-type amino acid transport system permease subunit